MFFLRELTAQQEVHLIQGQAQTIHLLASAQTLYFQPPVKQTEVASAVSGMSG
jgi:hypothetical protein